MIITRGSTIRILIVDDEDSILEEAAEALTDEGFECLVANSVAAAVEIVKTTPGIVLILTDLKMPGQSGVDLINTVKIKLGGKMKFIVMSGHADLNIEDNGIDITSYPFLTKPLDIDHLVATVASVLTAKAEPL